MSQQDKAQALRWYVQGIDLITIAQHFGVSVETLRVALHNQGERK